MTPVFALMFGYLLNAFWAADLMAEINKFALIILGVAGAAFISGESWRGGAGRPGILL